MQKKKTMNKRTGAAETDEQRISCRSSFHKPLRCHKTALSRGIRRFFWFYKSRYSNSIVAGGLPVQS